MSCPSAPRPLAFFAVLLLAPGSLAPAVLAQTPAAEIKDAANVSLMQVNTDAGLVAHGTFGAGAIPATGAGVRLMWFPAKAAFRAGFVDAAQWDDANVGLYSAATGYGTMASGKYATALGFGATASGFAATATGSSTTATGISATAMGVGTTAQAFGSLALGRFNVAAGTATAWVATDPLLIGGDGTSDAARSNAFVIFKNGAAQFGGTVTASVASPSDAWLKEDVAPLGPVLSRVMALRPVTYRYRAETGRSRAVQVGLIAQEVQAVLPELVETAPDGYLSVQYGNLAPVAVAAIQEQQGVIERQGAEIAALRERLAALERRLDTAPAAPAAGRPR